MDDELAQELEANRHFQAFGASKFFELAVRFFLKCKAKYGIDIHDEYAYRVPRVREEFEQEMKLWEDQLGSPA